MNLLREYVSDDSKYWSPLERSGDHTVYPIAMDMYRIRLVK